VLVGLAARITVGVEMMRGTGVTTNGEQDASRMLKITTTDKVLGNNCFILVS
jgi:hypothetical protein